MTTCLITQKSYQSMPAKFGDVVLGKIDLAGSFETIQHHTVTFPLEQSFF
jgi:hypothetical protein